MPLPLAGVVTSYGIVPQLVVHADLSPGTCSTAPSLASVASSRAAVDFGRPDRSATSVTPSGPSDRAPSTSKARLMDWTLDMGPFVV